MNIPMCELGFASGWRRIARFVPVRLGCKTVVVTAKAASDVRVHAALKSRAVTKINIDRIILKNIFNPSFCIFTRVRHPLYFGSMVLKPASRKPRGLLIIFNVSSLSSPFFFFFPIQNHAVSRARLNRGNGAERPIGLIVGTGCEIERV